MRQDRRTFEVVGEQPYIYRLCKLSVVANRRGKRLEFAAAGDLERTLALNQAILEMVDQLARAGLDSPYEQLPGAAIRYVIAANPQVGTRHHARARLKAWMLGPIGQVHVL